MNYLFFDIEASEGKSMCSFGYVLTDEDFCIIEKKDILINPEAQFCTQARSKKNQDKNKGISLAYTPKVFYKNPTFALRYDEIKEIISRPNQMIIGFSHVNDTRYLRIACERYNKENFSYTFFDVQDMYRDYKERKDQVSLEKIMAELDISVEGYTLHKSVDDAELSMLVAKAVCSELNCTMEKLIEKYPRFVGTFDKGVTAYKGLNSEQSKLRKKRNACKSVVYNFSRTVNVGNEKTVLKVTKKKFCVSSTMEKDEPIFVIKLIYILAQAGAYYVSSVPSTDYYVVFDSDKNSRGRATLAKDLQQKGYPLTVISESQLYDMLNVTKKDIDEVCTPKIQKTVSQIIKIMSRKD